MESKSINDIIDTVIINIKEDAKQIEKLLKVFKYLKSREYMDDYDEENVLSLAIGPELMSVDKVEKYSDYIREIMTDLADLYPEPIIQYSSTMMTIELRLHFSTHTIFGSIYLTEESINVHLWQAFGGGYDGKNITKYFKENPEKSYFHSINSMKDEVLKDIKSLINEV